MAETQNDAAKAAEAAKAKAIADAAAAKAAEAPKAEAKPKRHTGRAAYALHRINGTIEPGTLFRPNNAAERDELEALGAIRDLTDAEETLFEKTGEGTVVGDDDPVDPLG